MNPEITIMAEGSEVEESKIQTTLESIQETNITKIGQDRGLVEKATKVAMWTAEFIGDTAKFADRLIEQATKELAGASIKVKFGDTEIEVDNINRSQIVELLETVRKIAKEKGEL